MHFVQWHSVPARRRSSISLVFIVLKQLFAISVYLVIIFLNFLLPIYEIYTFFPKPERQAVVWIPFAL